MDERELLEDYRAWLRTTARGMLGFPGARYIDDLAQEGWLAIWKEYRKSGISDEPYLRTVARNAMRNVIRDVVAPLAREQLLGDVAEDMALALPPPSDISDVETVIGVRLDVKSIQRRNAIALALGELSVRQRAYVLDRFWHGIGPEQIKERYGQLAHYPLWYRARARLATELESLAA